MYEMITNFFETFSLASLTARMIIAVLLGGLIGLERSKQGQAAGLRTHVLVCLGSSLSAIIGLYTTEVLGYNSDPLRVGAQVVSGIGFLGVGTILVVGKSHIKGLTTAAGLWTTACIGLACGIGYISIVVISTIIVWITMTLMTKIEIARASNHNNVYFFVELNDPNKVNEFISYVQSKYSVYEVRVMDSKSKLMGHVGIQLVISDLNNHQVQEILDLSKESYVTYSVQSF